MDNWGKIQFALKGDKPQSIFEGVCVVNVSHRKLDWRTIKDDTHITNNILKYNKE